MIPDHVILEASKVVSLKNLKKSIDEFIERKNSEFSTWEDLEPVLKKEELWDMTRKESMNMRFAQECFKCVLKPDNNGKLAKFCIWIGKFIESLPLDPDIDGEVDENNEFRNGMIKLVKEIYRKINLEIWRDKEDCLKKIDMLVKREKILEKVTWSFNLTRDFMHDKKKASKILNAICAIIEFVDFEKDLKDIGKSHPEIKKKGERLVENLTRAKYEKIKNSD